MRVKRFNGCPICGAEIQSTQVVYHAHRWIEFEIGPDSADLHALSNPRNCGHNDGSNVYCGNDHPLAEMLDHLRQNGA